MKRKHNNSPHNTSFETCITVTADECRGDAEKMVRKFCKKVKRSGVIDELRDRQYHKKPSIARAEKLAAKKRLIAKVNKRRTELFNFSTGHMKRR
jgi:ribosomal protein S21